MGCLGVPASDYRGLFALACLVEDEGREEQSPPPEADPASGCGRKDREEGHFQGCYFSEHRRSETPVVATAALEVKGDPAKTAGSFFVPGIRRLGGNRGC